MSRHIIVPPPDVQAAIEDGTAQILRKVEIYESDGVTRWYPNNSEKSRLIDGNVNIDSNRDERRTLDLTLDNFDNALKPNAYGGLWYDKIVKPFRGVRYNASLGELNPNPYFESNVNYYESNSIFGSFLAPVSFPRSTARAHQGVASMLITWPVMTAGQRSWVNINDGGGDAPLAAIVGVTYKTSAWVWVPTGSPLPYFEVAFVSASQKANLMQGWNGYDAWSYMEWYWTVPTNVGYQFLGIVADGATTAGKTLNVDEWKVTPQISESHDWFVQLGEFVIDNISESHFPHVVKISGRDYTKRCMTSKLERPESFVAGTNIYDLITSLAANSGIVKIKMESTYHALTTRLDFDRGTERWAIMKEAANSINRQIYFDHEGYLVWEPYADPALQPAEVTFQTGPSGNLVSYDRSVNDSQLYNHILIYGDPGEGEERLPYVGEAINTEPSSPTRVERVGDRLFSYASAFFSSPEECQELAESWLKIYSLESYEFSFAALVYPWLDAGVVADVIEPDQQALDPTHFLLDTIGIPLGLGTMSGSAKRVTVVSNIVEVS